MSLPGENLPPHVDLRADQVEAFIDLYHRVPVAEFPDGMEVMLREKSDGLAELHNERLRLVARNDLGQPIIRDPGIELTLPEVMQAFKTAATFDFVKALALDLRNDGYIEKSKDEYFNWDLDEPRDRRLRSGLLSRFLKYWPDLCGHDTMIGPRGTRSQYYSFCRFLNIAILKFVMQDFNLEIVMKPDEFGWLSETLTQYRNY